MELQLPAPGETILAMLKLPGEMCNINCHYCYERRKPYPNALMLKPEVLRKFLGLCEGRPLAVELHGGEPCSSAAARWASSSRSCAATRAP